MGLVVPTGGVAAVVRGGIPGVVVSTGGGIPGVVVSTLVERFDIEPFSDFSSK